MLNLVPVPATTAIGQPYFGITQPLTVGNFDSFNNIVTSHTNAIMKYINVPAVAGATDHFITG